MRDEQLTDAWEAGARFPAGISHVQHVRIAWVLHWRHGPEEANARLLAGTKRACEVHGCPEKFNAALTERWSNEIAAAIERSGFGSSADEFLEMHPDLSRSDLLDRVQAGPDVQPGELQNDAVLIRRPPQKALTWVVDSVAPGGGIISVRALHGGRWHANHLIAVADHDGDEAVVVLRRWARPEWQTEDPDLTVEREVAALELLGESPVPAPRVIAADPSAMRCDVPALILTRLAGAPPTWNEAIQPRLPSLAAALWAIHELDPSRASGIPAYRRYYEPSDPRLQQMCDRSTVWRRALALISQPAPKDVGCFIHRDYHPGNTLWSDDRLIGIVDWTQASIGSPSIDVAHMRWNLVVDYGIEVANEFLALYENHRGTVSGHDPYWDIVTVMDVLPEIAPSDPAAEADLNRLEEYVAKLLAWR